jgi:hypothetical protein
MINISGGALRVKLDSPEWTLPVSAKNLPDSGRGPFSTDQEGIDEYRVWDAER